VTDGVKPAGVCACETPTKPTKNSPLLYNRIFKKMGKEKSGNPLDMPEWALYISAR